MIENVENIDKCKKHLQSLSEFLFLNFSMSWNFLWITKSNVLGLTKFRALFNGLPRKLLKKGNPFIIVLFSLTSFQLATEPRVETWHQLSWSGQSGLLSLQSYLFTNIFGGIACQFWCSHSLHLLPVPDMPLQGSLFFPWVLFCFCSMMEG